MAFHWPFFSKPSAVDMGDLRDRCIIAETKAVFLENEVERLRRPKRERRRDAANVIAAKAAMTAALRRSVEGRK